MLTSHPFYVLCSKVDQIGENEHKTCSLVMLLLVAVCELFLLFLQRMTL